MVYKDTKSNVSFSSQDSVWLVYIQRMARVPKSPQSQKSVSRRKPSIPSASSPAAHLAAFNLAPTVSKRELLDSNSKSDRQFRQMLYDISVLASQLDYARSHLASQVGLSSPQYNIVMIVAHYQGDRGVSVSEVAQRLHVSTAFITSETGKLERAGLIRKSPNPSDGRSILLQLTERGEDAVQQLGPQRLAVNDQLFRNLSGKDFRHLSTTIASLLNDFFETVNLLKAMKKTESYRRDRSVVRDVDVIAPR